MNLTIVNERLNQLESEMLRFQNGRARQILAEIGQTRGQIAAFIGATAPAVPRQSGIVKLAELEKAAILNAMAVHKNGNLAAEALGISKTTLYRKLQEYDKERGAAAARGQGE